MRRILRIYYESIEQALHFVTPLVNEAPRASELTIEYVRASWRTVPARGAIAAFLSLNDADLLLTVVADGKDGPREYPLLAMEFSEAVKTEDHELQRATVAAASRFSGIPAVKISGERKSKSAHGGNTKFDPHLVVRMFRSKRATARYFYQEWPSKDGRLQVQPDALVCPELAGVPIVRALVSGAVAVAADPLLYSLTAEECCARVVAHAERTAALAAHNEKLAAAVVQKTGLCASVLGGVCIPATDGVWFKKRACVSEDQTLYVKVYRFDHSADPDRGTVLALSLSWPKRVVVLYQIKGGGKAKNRPNLAAAYADESGVVAVFAGYASDEGLPAWLVEAVRARGRPKSWVDLTDVVEAHRNALARSRVLMMLFGYSDGLLVQVRREGAVEWFGVQWSRDKLQSHPDSFYRGFETAKPLEPIALARADSPNEDEVTYVTVHRVLRPNGFSLIHVSYPGHQGGEPILNESQKGRTRNRGYVDIVAVTPVQPLPSLTEAKDRISAGLAKDVEKLKRIRTDAALRSGLGSVLRLRQVRGWNGDDVVLSVAFGAGGSTKWKPDGMDFIVRLNGRTTFDVAPFGSAHRYFPVALSGASSLPVTHVPVSRSEGNLFST